ncbi:unnamed protein product [Rotaria socialis]|uniref:procollagen-proline 4-dioxygenase n=1 Tax=Rotaria socialis TaxID=392032 RepID=A0A820MEC2_9BILA|nr:unnamed protein product [Rotaria socialis]CAF4151097.1 unnamed protein product [Rotaria socialis]CAF4371284.1 unnamed protein product [Rotaria socialis]CAF4421526.1 unnamed protein product [Rotaria socialis]CAF4651055.1 unnamed protein product [Rotaria socialis]
MSIQSDLFTSTTHLSHLLNTEVGLAKQLDIYLKEEYERLDHIEKFVNVIKDEIRQAQGNEEYYFGNPVNSYLFIKHLTADWNNIEQLLPTDSVKNIGSKWLFPTFEDYTGSAIGLMRLQDTYELNTSQLANGELSSKFKSKRLSALECYDLGRVAYTNGDFYHTLMWMQEALDHLDTETNHTSINKIDILDHLAYATSQQGNVEHALAITEEILTMAPDHFRAQNNKVYYETIIKNRTLTKKQRRDDIDKSNSTNLKLIQTASNDESYKINNKRSDDYFDEQESYEHLCRQNGTRLHPKYQSKLFCRYRHNNHPYLILQPVKEEQLLHQPAILFYHDIISDSDIEKIKSLALPKLQRAVVRDFTTDTFQPADYRIFPYFSAWLRNEDSPVIARLSRLIEAITNLSMITAEDLQIANYGVGGHYEPHFDFSRRREKDPLSRLGAGNRIATWLTYLSDVEEGGATVFPLAGGHLKPKKGGAAFWYNLYASGEGDYNTRHAACPVLIGNKWVANKWIHERGQEFRRPCSLNPMV